MKSIGILLFLVSFLLPFAGAAETVVVTLVGADGKSSAARELKMEVRRTREKDGFESIRVRVVSQAEGERRARIVASRALKGGETQGYDGHRQVAFPKSSKTALLAEAFPLLAAWKGEKGVALALGAEAFDSYVDAETRSDALVISVRAAFLRKGQVYETVFHAFDFHARYAERDAYARYYRAYPARFTRDPAVNPAVYGASANYAAWRRADPEPARFLHAGSECCIGASRTWGDPLDREQPDGPRNTTYAWDEELGYINRDGVYIRKKTGEITREEFDFHRDARLSYGYYCGVANCYYVMALAHISKAIAARYPDSVAVGKTFSDTSYSYAPIVFTFPECAWGRKIREDLAELADTADISAIYFDVARPCDTYRGECLRAMTNVSWDAYGPAVMRSIGSAKLFEDVRKLREKKGGHALGVNINSRFQHIYDIFYADASEEELQPWEKSKPFPIERRLAAGEKGFSLWEGFRPADFDPNFRTWSDEEKRLLYNALSRFAIHASFRAGALLPVSFLSEYTALMSHAFERMNLAGWKPVPGAIAADPDWEVARYGRGLNAFLTANNLLREARTLRLRLHPAEIETDRAGGEMTRGILFVPFYGGESTTRLSRDREAVACRVGPQLAAVLEAVGHLTGEGTLKAAWAGDFDTETLTVTSRDFAGEVELKEAIDSYRLEGAARRRLAPGETLTAVYRETELPGAAAKIRAAGGFAEVRHAPDSDSTDLAARIVHFFASVPGGGEVPKAVADAALPPNTVVLAGVRVTSPDRWIFSRRVTRLIDLVNRLRHPEYVVPMNKWSPGKLLFMDPADKAYFPHVRL